MVKNMPTMRETWLRSLGWEDPLKGNAPTPVFEPGEFHGQRSLVGYSPWGHRESDATERLKHKLWPSIPKQSTGMHSFVETESRKILFTL